MKINEPRQPDVSRTDTSRQDPHDKNVRDKDDKKSFSNAMRKTRERNAAEGETVPAQPGQQPATFQQRDLKTAEVKAARGAADAVLAENLAKEIVLTTQGPDDHQINIQFNSQTLAGLRVQVERQNGLISVRFFTQTDDTNRLVNANVDQLAQSLQAKGLALNTIQVQGPDKREETRRYHHRDGRQGGGQQGGRHNR